ncbi:unnamed protein product [Symbiodinium sp. CCMP2592]|nr:unnamed protein product [Symbiodinium sp. CCMP2592]
MASSISTRWACEFKRLPMRRTSLFLWSQDPAKAGHVSSRACPCEGRRCFLGVKIPPRMDDDLPDDFQEHFSSETQADARHARCVSGRHTEKPFVAAGWRNVYSYGPRGNFASGGEGVC